MIGDASQAHDDAVKRSADNGIFYAVAVGNKSDDALASSCRHAPVLERTTVSRRSLLPD